MTNLYLLKILIESNFQKRSVIGVSLCKIIIIRMTTQCELISRIQMLDPQGLSRTFADVTHGLETTLFMNGLIKHISNLPITSRLCQFNLITARVISSSKTFSPLNA